MQKGVITNRYMIGGIISGVMMFISGIVGLYCAVGGLLSNNEGGDEMKKKYFYFLLGAYVLWVIEAISLSGLA